MAAIDAGVVSAWICFEVADFENGNRKMCLLHIGFVEFFLGNKNSFRSYYV